MVLQFRPAPEPQGHTQPAAVADSGIKGRLRDSVPLLVLLQVPVHLQHEFPKPRAHEPAGRGAEGADDELQAVGDEELVAVLQLRDTVEADQVVQQGGKGGEGKLGRVADSAVEALVQVLLHQVLHQTGELLQAERTRGHSPLHLLYIHLSIYRHYSS